jgi:hypothetical protein
MSLGTTYVRAVDGKFYAEPVFRGVTSKGNRWYLCFDEDDDPELVLEITHGKEKPNALLPAFCRTDGRLTTATEGGERVFGVDGTKWLFAKAISFWVKCHTRIDVPTEYDKSRQPSTQKTGLNGTYYDFEKRGRNAGK